MPLHTPPAAHRSRAAYTLAELLVASVAGSMLLAGLASAMYIAGQVAYSPVHSQRLLQNTTTVFDLADEVRHAIYVVDHGATFIEFVTEDRNGDGVEDTIRYAWSGTAGDPLTKSLNRGTPVNVVESVSNFNLTYTVEPQEEALEVTTAGTELQLGPTYSISEPQTYAYLQSSRHLAHRVNVSGLPSTARSWSLARISFYARSDGGSGGGEDGTESPGEFAIQLRKAATGGLPTSAILAEWVVPESTLSGWKWYSVSPSRPMDGLSPHENFCVVFQWRNGSVAARLGTDTGSDLMRTTDDGATWQRSGTERLMVHVHALPHADDEPLTFSRDRLVSAHVSLQGESGFSRIDTSVTLENAPPVVEKAWQTDFAGDPLVQDRNGDGTADFTWSGGSTFDMSTIIGGVWQISGYLRADHPGTVTTPVVVEACGESIGTGSDGLTARTLLPRSGSEHLNVALSLVLQPDGTQTARLLAHNGSTMHVLTTAERLPARPLDLRVVVDPVRALASLRVSGVDYPVAAVPVIGSSLASASLIATENSSHAEFDWISFEITRP